MKIKTTVKELRSGVKLSAAKGDEVQWESTGHLSVRLLDASGHHPLTDRAVTVDIPGEGYVSLQTNAKGEVFHPDVPFKDYELDVDGVKVFVPAVGEKSEVHERHVAAAPMGFVQGVLYTANGILLADDKVEVEFPSGSVKVQTGPDGVFRCHHLESAGGNATIRHESGECTTSVLASPQKLVRLELESKR